MTLAQPIAEYLSISIAAAMAGDDSVDANVITTDDGLVITTDDGKFITTD